MKAPKHTVEEYAAISGDIWMVFKKYFDDDADTSEFTKDVHVLDIKYKKNPRIYEFTQRLMRVYFQELMELKLRDRTSKDAEVLTRLDGELKKFIEVLQQMRKELGV